MKAEDLLREAGLLLEVVPPPANLSAGCGLALRIAEEDVEAAKATLSSESAAFSAIHALDRRQNAGRRLG
jgi:hypothetical protein